MSSVVAVSSSTDPSPVASPDDPLSGLDLELDRDEFVRRVLRELTGLLQDVVGREDAEGFVSVAGRALGADLDARYRAALGLQRFDRDQVAAILVDLKRRIQGGFRLVSVDDQRIELVNDTCPFAEHVDGRPALCMMTSNVFGHLVSTHLGYARVEIREAIAEGHGRCHVLVHLTPDAAASGRAYLRVEDTGP